MKALNLPKLLLNHVLLNKILSILHSHGKRLEGVFYVFSEMIILEKLI